MRAGVSLLALLSVVATACAPGLGADRPTGALSGTPSQDDTRTLVVASKLEPKVLVGTALNPTHVGISPGAHWQIFHAGLTQADDKNTFQLQLAEAFPRLGTDSWQVFPDGRMETTWRLRPNLTWHDGAPLVADDFVLSIRVSTSVGRSALVVPGLDEIVAPDPRTVVIRYKTPTPGAGETILQPVPRHILGPTLEQMEAADAFTLPYWTTEFVGAGPYRLERWEPGAFITGVAFPGYVNGKPRIGRIQAVWIGDPNTAVANLLSETVDLATDFSITFEQVSVLRREWAARGEPGTMLLSTVRTVYVQRQFRPEYVNPTALLDVRLRQALAHAIDKQAIVDAVLDGEPGMADTLAAKEAEYYPELDQQLTKYPLDLRRADQLLSEMGLTKDGEGFYGQTGTRLTASLTPVGATYPREALVLADGWKRAGIETPIRTLSAAEQADPEIGSTYPALSINYTGTDNALLWFTSASIASPATRWSGKNQGGYADPEIDRLTDVYATSLDRNDRNRAVVQALTLLSDQAGYFPLYYGYDVVAHAGSLVGPSSAIKFNAMWNVKDWHWK